jgi:hypothetical protein
MSEPAQTPPAKSLAAATGGSGATSAPGRRASIVGAVGALLVIAAVGMVAMKAGIGIKPGDSAQPTVSYVEQSEIGAAATTLTPSSAAALVEDAQRCKIPLVSMTISRGSAAPGSTIRIRSGNYVSPHFTITDAVQRIAVPYPAPYGSGAGTFVIEGTATGAILGLTPTRVLIELPGAQSIPVAWRVVSPC